MKRNLIILSVVLIVAAGIFFISKKEVSLENTSQTTVSTGQDKVLDGAQGRVSDSKRVEEASKLNQPDDVDLQMKKWDEEYDRIEKEWNNLVSQLFSEELHLSKEVYEDYLKLRDGLSNDKIRAFEAFHKEMEAKYGENYTYNPTDEEMSFERDIQKKYDSILKEKIGEDNFTKYQILRDNYNNTLIEKQNPDDGVILMDF